MMNNNPLFNWQDIAGILPKLLENLPVTLGITLASLLLGLTIALLIVLLQFSRFKPLSAVANGYTDILRGAPGAADPAVFLRRKINFDCAGAAAAMD
jgi:L-cystine transport system permease protein